MGVGYFYTHTHTHTERERETDRARNTKRREIFVVKICVLRVGAVLLRSLHYKLEIQKEKGHMQLVTQI